MLLALLVLGAPAQLDAQQGWRKWVFAAAGAVLIGAPASIAEEQDDMFCGTRPCMISAGAALGATVGFLLGRELDAKQSREDAVGPRLRLDARAVQLEFAPTGLALHDGGAVAIGTQGLARVDLGGGLHPLGGDIRGVTAVAAFPDRGALLAATPAGIFAFQLDGGGEGRQLLPHSAGVLAALGPAALLLGRGPVWQRLRLSGQGAGVTLEEVASVEAGEGVAVAAAHAAYAGTVWTLTGTRLTARTETSLAELGTLTLPARGRSLSLDGGRALIAAGGDGLFLADVSRPEAPRLIAQLRGVDFAFDAVLVGDQAYVAAGGLGLLVVDITDPVQPQITGVARELGFVADVERGSDGRLWALDREGARVHVVEPRPGSPGS
ncbi:MAG TPA: hypothetical protein VMK65_00915 [Longimicrobiales bacterium]|nr:hypothetical protein [Longimicrobiales bacterium]